MSSCLAFLADSAIFVVPYILATILFLLWKAQKKKRETFYDYQFLEIIGKMFILFAVCFQLFTIASITSEKIEVLKLDSQESDNLARAQTLQIRGNLDAHDARILAQVLSIRNNQLMNHKLKTVDINDKDIKNLSQKIDEVTTVIPELIEQLENELGEIHESNRQTNALIKFVDNSRKNISKHMTLLDKKSSKLNMLFLAWFLAGSLLVIMARVFELKFENQKT